MGLNKTLIDWVKNPDGTQGYTWNPITGCLNHVNGLCKGGGFPCYAYRLAHGRLRKVYTQSRGWKINYDPAKQGYTDACLDPFYPRFWPERLEQPFEIKGSAGIFPCDMSDLFGIGIPHRWTEAVMNVIKIADRHRFYLLTKQPQNLPQWSPFPDNCWVGVTITNADAYEPAINSLAKIEAKIRYISFEPLLENPDEFAEQWSEGLPIVDWLIIGAQTKPYKPPKIEWVQEIVEAADKAGIPMFLKGSLGPLLPMTKLFYSPMNPSLCKGCDHWDLCPPDESYCGVIWKLRQEMPLG